MKTPPYYRDNNENEMNTHAYIYTHIYAYMHNITLQYMQNIN